MTIAAETRAQEFRERLSHRALVADGAMGTMLYSRGVFINRSFDELNLSAPELVRHAGAHSPAHAPKQRRCPRRGPRAPRRRCGAPAAPRPLQPS